LVEYVFGGDIKKGAELMEGLEVRAGGAKDGWSEATAKSTPRPPAQLTTLPALVSLLARFAHRRGTMERCTLPRKAWSQ